jgi:hypothetical protein
VGRYRPHVQGTPERLLDRPPTQLVEHFGRTGSAFIVARLGCYVVFFDDVEDSFCTAENSGEILPDTTDYVHIALALQELERLHASNP